MKKIILIICAIFSVICAKAQTEKKMYELINHVLVSYLEDRKDIQTLFLLTDYYPFGFTFNDKIIGMNLQYISIKNPIDKKKIRKRIHVIFFDGMEINKNQLEIKFSERYVKSSGKSIGISISSWIKYIYNYSCEKDEWIFIETIYG